MECIPLEDELMQFNSSLRAQGTYVSATCPKGYHIVGPDVIHCQGQGIWTPYIPHCSKDAKSTSTTVIIIITCLASIVCLVVLGLALFMLLRRQKVPSSGIPMASSDTKSMDYDEKMKSINQYSTASQDSVGMPAIKYDTLDVKLRGKMSQSSVHESNGSTPTLSSPQGVDGSPDKVFIY